MADNDKVEEIYEAAQAIEENFENQYLDLLEVFHEWDRIPEEEHDSDVPQYRVIAVVDGVPNDSVFTGPLCDLGRENGLYVYDHTVRHGAATQGPHQYDVEYDSSLEIEVRFALRP